MTTISDKPVSEKAAVQGAAPELSGRQAPEAAPAGVLTLTFAKALTLAMADALAADPSVVVFGEDVGTLGGVFRVTDGLTKRFGEERCFDTPLAESGIMGMAVGMAMNGMRPVVEMQFDAFAYPAFEQVVSHVAKMPNRTKGKIKLPLVIRIPYAGGIGGVEHHCDSSEAYYVHTPGLTVLAPSTVADAYTMLRDAINCPDPVVFLEPKKLYFSRERVDLDALRAPYVATADDGGAVGSGGRASEPVGSGGRPSEPVGSGGRPSELRERAETPASSIGKAVIAREGTDATLIAYGPSVPTALAAAEAAAQEGRSLQVIDVRSLVPFDDETVCAAVRSTGRAVVIAEAPGFASVAAEIVARVQERCFHSLAAPVRRVTGFDIPYPAPKLEQHFLPSVDRILDVVDELQWEDQ